jgi:hypothetical protein
MTKPETLGPDAFLYDQSRNPSFYQSSCVVPMIFSKGCLQREEARLKFRFNYQPPTENHFTHEKQKSNTRKE